MLVCFNSSTDPYRSASVPRINPKLVRFSSSDQSQTCPIQFLRSIPNSSASVPRSIDSYSSDIKPRLKRSIQTRPIQLLGSIDRSPTWDRLDIYQNKSQIDPNSLSLIDRYQLESIRIPKMGSIDRTYTKTSHRSIRARRL
jgi:hypothetical protein